ncbi:MAG: hypothetical protein QF777_00245 [Acidimicrobiales bacterium]|nr:hypothetical protein [Acidimicrobiales bacterium]MDP6909977.1 hypothetical protein [Acidimicrobiales bacterium]
MDAALLQMAILLLILGTAAVNGLVVFVGVRRFLVDGRLALPRY